MDENPKIEAYSEHASIYEDNVPTTSIEDPTRTVIIDERIIEAPVARNVFDVAESVVQISDDSSKTDTLSNYDYIELDSVSEKEKQVTKVVTTTVIENNEFVLKVTEQQRTPIYDEVVIEDEKAERAVDVVPNPAKKTGKKISTIPMNKNGEIKREEPLIPTLPPISAKGVGSNALETPYVLPATAAGRAMMASNANDEASKPDESSFDEAIRRAQDIPVAPIINREAPAVQPTNEAQPANEPVEKKTIVADEDVEIVYPDSEAPIIPDVEPEIEEEPEVHEEPEAAEEPEAVEEPEVPEEEIPVQPPVEEEPAVDPEPEVEEEPEVVPEPIAEPIFVDAEQADELMTDEEAEEHIEIIEEAPGRERKGKLHAINLDTLCESFDDGETVTLEALKKKNLAPQNSGRVKILARGRMTKNLDIVADSFSLQAVKMITLAGGRAEQYK